MDPTQTFVERLPAAPVATTVTAMWSQRVGGGAAPYRQRHVPNGQMELRWASGGPVQLVGPRTRPVLETLAPGTTIVGLRLRTGVTLDGVGPAGLVDGAVDVADLWPDTAPLADEIIAVRSPDDIADRLGRLVLARVAPGEPLVTALVDHLHWRRHHLGPLADDLGLTQRQLRRACTAATGLLPKVLHRMVRFQDALALAQARMADGRPAAGDGLADLAHQARYADQAHLARECLRLTGLPPSGFFGDAERTCACGHDHAASYTPVLRARDSQALAHTVFRLPGPSAG
jgi:AraC-like DNA-binding protein